MDRNTKIREKVIKYAPSFALSSNREFVIRYRSSKFAFQANFANPHSVI